MAKSGRRMACLQDEPASRLDWPGDERDRISRAKEGREPKRMTPEQIAELRQNKYNATVVKLTKAHSDLMTIRVRPDFVLPVHKPGQYTSIGLGYWEPRHPGCQE